MGQNGIGHPNKMFRFLSPSTSWKWVGRSVGQKKKINKIEKNEREKKENKEFSSNKKTSFRLVAGLVSLKVQKPRRLC